LRQQPPFSQSFPEQQGSPGPPQARQLLFLQTVPSAQTLFEQQAWPGPPQVTQLPPAQFVPGSVHDWPEGQHAMPSLPQFVGVHSPA
jgi:hypothetical protein